MGLGLGASDSARLAVRVRVMNRVSVRLSFRRPTPEPGREQEPWTTFSYTSGSGVVAVPCRAISAVRMHPGRDNPSFEIEYVGSPEAEAAKKKGSGGVLVRMRVWPASQEHAHPKP